MIYAVDQLESLAELEEKYPGPLLPENKLKWMLHQALMNANGLPVFLTVTSGVADAPCGAHCSCGAIFNDYHLYDKCFVCRSKDE